MLCHWSARAAWRRPEAGGRSRTQQRLVFVDRLLVTLVHLRPGVRLRTLEDLFAYAGAEGVAPRVDGTEVQVRRPRAHRPGRLQ
ncbi:hypothetical protein ACFWR9_18370 [Streptomyces sp. NPDC058534]|uniref:hypothetical protein n=1 Tax=Streptomyces sp. NPDC058534 TaxID=3346541 RepID=UPI00366118D7